MNEVKRIIKAFNAKPYVLDEWLEDTWAVFYVVMQRDGRVVVVKTYRK